MNNAVATNPFLKILATTAFNTLDTGHWFKLYVNDYYPTPDSVFTDFTEASFTGYAAFNLAGKFSPPILTFTGQYEIDATAGPFACEVGSQFVYGCYILDSISVKIAQRFDSPVFFQPGTFLQFPVQIFVDTYGILCPS